MFFVFLEFIQRESKHAHKSEAEKEVGRERIPSRLCTCAETDARLEFTNYEIMT